MQLASGRLILRPITASDIGALHTLWTNAEVRRYLWNNEVIPLARVEEIVRSSEAFFAEHGTGFFSVRLCDAPEGIIGFCGNRLFPESQDVELLYGVHPDYWKQGIGTEAARLVLAHGFERCRFDRVVAATDTPNQRSVKVLQRLGLFFDRRETWQGLDTVFYAISREEYEELRADAV